MPATIEIVIDRIVLHGYDQLDRSHLRAVIQEQLTRMLTEQGLSHTFLQQTEYETLTSESLSNKKGQSAGVIGREIASGIFRSLQRPNNP